MAKQPFSIPSLMKRLDSEASAYLLLEELRWGGEPVCPHCGVIGGHYYLTPKDDAGRKTRTGTRSERRVWKCKACRRQFTVLVGTIFHGTKISIRTWVLVVAEVAASKNGISAREVERKYDLTPKTAWFMLHRIREAMKRDPMAGLISGQIQADETFIGGEPKNRHANDPREAARGRQMGQTDQTPVFALVNYETREVRSRVIPDVTGKTLLAAIQDDVDMSRTMLHTDSAKAYNHVSPHMRGHEAVSHAQGEYVRNGVSTNILENYFSQLKRSIDGTNHHVSVEHLPRYLAQFDFLYTSCRASDSERMVRMIRNTAGRRLSYKPLTAG